MPNFFYFDQFDLKQGPVNDLQLKELATQGVITPTTPLETDTGHKGTAGQIPGLFAAPPQQSYQQSPQYSQPQTNIFCSNCGQSVHLRAAVCPYCGVPPRAEKRFCTNCGTTIANPKQVVCLQCGAALQSVSPVGTGNAEYVDANALGIGFWDILKNKYGMIDGRARRQEFWMFTLWQTLILLVPMLIGFGFIGAGIGMESPVAAGIGVLFIVVEVILAIAMMCPAICLQVRRLHDSGKSGWLWFIGFVPYVGWLIVLVLMCLDSQRGDNQYGPNPKGEY